MSTLALISPIDPATGARVDVRVCASQDSLSTGAAGSVWWPAITLQPSLKVSLFDGDFTSPVDPASAQMEVRLDVLARTGLFPRLLQFDWAGAKVTLYRMVAGAPVTLAEMQVERFAIEDFRLALSLIVDTEPFAADVLSLTYAGTSGAEGGVNIKGQVKPWVFGRAQNVEAAFIDQIDNVFQVSGYGPVSAIPAIYERGASFGPSVGNFANYAALVAASIPPGRWGTCLAQGLFRLGAPPAGVITCDVDGDTTTGFLRRTGAIITEIARRLGLSAKLDDASVGALDAAVPRNINIVINEQVSFIDLIRRMVAPCNAVAGLGLDGRLITPRVAFGVEALTLDAQGRQLPPVLGMARQNTRPPYKRIQLGAAQSWRVHTFDEIAFFADLIERGIYSGAETYREGNIVESADKSRWIYSNPVASSGNPPPIWPSTGNAFWSNLAPPLNPTAIGLETGATRNVPRGTYENATTYVRGDNVLFSGSAYQLIVESSTGNSPPDALRWALIANAGSGPPGADGLEGITVIVTNEAHTVATAADGSGGNYGSAGGQMILRRGATLLAPAFSIAAATPNTGWISINSAGIYTVTDPGVDLATATIRATWAGVNYDRTYTLAKSKQGVDGPTLMLVPNNQAFTFTNGVANPASQTITLEARLSNLTGTATWSTIPSVTLGGSGNTRTLTLAQFGANRQVTVQATLGGLTDRITIVRLERDLNTEVVLQGTLAARPTTGQFVGQNYLVTSGDDAGVLFTWNGSAWVAGPTRGAPPGTLVGGVEASGLVDDAARAKADAAQSLIDLTAIASDSVLTRGEKINVRERRDNIINEFPIWRDRGIALSISPDTRSSYQQSYNELLAYLTAVNVNANSNTNINRADFVAAFNNYALARERVIDAVAVAASQRASWPAVADVPVALTDIRAADGRLNADRIGWIGLPGQSVNDFKPQEVNANRTENRVAASILSQGALATSTIPYVTMNGRQRLDSVDVYYADGIYVSSLRPQEVNSNRTEGRVASSVLNQTSWATLTASTNRLSRINDFGRISDPTIYNAQAILGPRNVSAIVPTYTVGGSNVTINLPAHTRRFAGPNGPLTLSYGAASGVEPFNAYWAAFVDDPNLTGFSSPPVQITNDPATLLFPGRYHIASGVTPGPGGAGGSTGSGGGGGSNGGGGFTAPNVPPGSNYP